MAAQPYTLYRTTRAAPAARLGAIGALVLLALGPVAVTALALGGNGGRAASANGPRAARPLVPPKPARTATISIAAVGDVALGSTAAGLPPDPDALFAEVRPLLRADVVTANLESALSDQGIAKCGEGRAGCYAFRAPPTFARSLRSAGFTLVNLANNHTRDAGDGGLADTRAALDAAGVAHTGAPGEIALLHVHGVRVAVVGFAPYPWAADLLDIPAAQRLVREASGRADVVVVQMHAGAEGSPYRHLAGEETYLGERRGDPVAFARAVVDAGADLVVGHGPHLLRAVEWYRGRLIAYSLGNFASYRNFALAGPLGETAVLRVRLHADGTWAGGRLVPVRLGGTGTPAPDPAAGSLATIRGLSRADIGRRAAVLRADGVLAPPAAAR